MAFDIDALIRQILAKAIPVAGAGIIASACGPLLPTVGNDGDAGARDSGAGYVDPCAPQSSDHWTVSLTPVDGGYFEPKGNDGGGYIWPVNDGGGLECPHCSWFSHWCTADGTADGGARTASCNLLRCVGRMTAGAAPTANAGDYLASMAEGEALSVGSFRRLERELRAHGASAGLIGRARTSARDEVRHARIADALSRRNGRPIDRTRPRIVSLPIRGFSEMVIENAVEGCLREAFGAIVGAYQAEHATDTAFRRAMKSIARDEARHAQLAFDVHQELAKRLPACAKTRLGVELDRAAASLLAPTLGHAAEGFGLPPPALARSMAEDFLAIVIPSLTRGTSAASGTNP